MKSALACLISLIVLATALTACQSMNPRHVNSPYCNQLNSQIVFMGGTSNTRQAEIDNAQQPLQQRNYNMDCTQ